MQLSERQIQETTAMLLIGDGVLGMLRPAAHCQVWRTGSDTWNAALDWFAARPILVRACGILELAVGLHLAERQLARVSAQEADAVRSGPAEASALLTS